MSGKITIKELKEKHLENNPKSIFFDETQLRAFGESIGNMSVLAHLSVVQDRFGFTHTCYVVSSLRFRKERVHYYFDSISFKLINPIRW